MLVTDLVTRALPLLVSLLNPTSQEEEGDRRIEAKQGVSRIHESFLLVRLQTQDDEPDVEPAQSKGKKSIRARFSLFWPALSRSQTSVVNFESKSERREGHEGEREKDVEVEQEVDKVERRRLGSIEVGRTTSRGEEVVQDDVECRKRRASVRVRVNEANGDLLHDNEETEPMH